MENGVMEFDGTLSYPECHEVGGMSHYAYEDDPKRIAFTAARYKHTAKLLEGCDRVLEIGCADGYFSRIVAQHVGSLMALDSDPKFIEEAKSRKSARWPVYFWYCDFLGPNSPGLSYGHFDAVYALDVLEHIQPDGEFLSRLRRVAPVAVIGTPSLESQAYASMASVREHVNCYSLPDLRARLRKFYTNVFVLTMNDESLGTGFHGMAQYLLALCVR
jgi:2-polyprenyl-3-methyl-5-hydroxy-6-metoxy-1,4-benzoquinol methylase